MTKPKLTAAQQRAVDWLPADGNWSSGAGYLGLPLSRIVRLFGNLVEFRTDPSVWGRANYRLTPAGVAMFHAPAIEEGT